MNLALRIESLRRRIEAEGLAGALISNPTNVAYITGFDGVFDGEDAHAAVVSPRELLLYSDGRYAEALNAAAAGGPWEVRIPERNIYVTLCQDMVDIGVDSLAVESSIPYGRFRFVSERFEGNVIAADQWVEEIRCVKDSGEIERIEAAQAISDAAFTHILPFLVPGASERDIALELETFMRRNGSDGVAFPAIVASGPNSALPHARATYRQIEADEFVKLDFGARVQGYCSDMTRTVVVGRATERHREVYSAVLAANLAGIAAAKAGVSGASVDEASRAVLTGLGFGEHFVHGVGHGVGLAVHELPPVGPRGTKSIPGGSVITIEPGVYIPGFGGVRIEDLVFVEDSGARVLTRSTKDLIEL